METHRADAIDYPTNNTTPTSLTHHHGQEEPKAMDYKDKPLLGLG